MIRTMKDRRSGLMFSRVLALLERGEVRIDDPCVLWRLELLRRGVHGSGMHRYLDQWERWILLRDVDSIRRLDGSEDEYSMQMLTLSPLNALLSEDQRLEVLRELHGVSNTLQPV
ncbi:hypothetical protein [Nocardia carnea]|uniref:Uncharacterized protein n=1 Tax=Nocardia carnea TaxID=37328 RepID=A0ABW7TL55_9NOCA|nr:hypothetical protein [Nocardia carnea]